MYAIKVAIENKTLEIIPDLIDTCRSHYINQSILSYQDQNGNTILHYVCAIDNDDVNTLKYILHMLNNKYNVNVNTNDIISARNYEIDTILHVACHHGHKQIVQYIIEHFQINNTMLNTLYNDKGRSPFLMACNKLDILQYYIQTRKIDVETTDRYGNTILYYASLYYQIDIIHYLRTVCHANELALNHENETALPYGYDYHEAAINGDINLLMQCIQNGIDIEATNSFGYTALNLACRYGNCNIVEYLISKCHANVTTFDLCGSNALHIACQYGHYDIVHCLIQQNHTHVAIKDKQPVNNSISKLYNI
jgi:ankyrin repeat protein